MRSSFQLAMLVGGVLLAVACDGPPPTPTAAPPEPAATSTPAPPTVAPAATQLGAPTAVVAKGIAIKIGVIAPASGANKTYGESTKNAFDMAVDEANTAGKVNISSVVADDKADATEGVSAATKMINEDKVKAIVGLVTSDVAIPVSEVAQSNKVVVISTTATKPEVTVDQGKRKDYVFRACFVNPFQGTVMARFALNSLKVKTAAVVYDGSGDYSKGLAEYFKDAFQKGGGKVTSYDSYGANDVDFSAMVTKIASDNPDFMFIPDYAVRVNLIARRVREKGVKAIFGGGDGWDDPVLDVEAVEGGYFSNHYSPEATTPVVQDWVKKYQARYNSVPDVLGTLAYDATNLLADAIVAAGSDDSTKIRDALAATKDFKGVSGNITFDKDGNPIKSAVVIKIENGKQKYVETVNP